MFKIVGVFVALTMFIVQYEKTSAQSVANSMGECIDWLEELATVDFAAMARRLLASHTGPEITLVDCMNSITKMNRNMEKQMGIANQKLDDLMRSVSTRMPLQMANNGNLQELQRIAGRVSSMWRRCFRVLTDVGEFSDSTVMDCVQGIISTAGNTVITVIHRMYDMVVGSGGVRFSDTFWETMLADSRQRTWEERTDKKTSVQYDMYQLHMLIVSIHYQAFELEIAAYPRLMQLKNESYESEIRFAMSEFIFRNEGFLTTAKVALSNADREIISGDPEEHVIGMNFERHEHLFWLRPMREEESELNTECKSTCSEMSYDGWKQNSIDGPSWNTMDCFGPMYDCHWMGPATVCATPWQEEFFKYIVSGYGTWGSTAGGCPGYRYDMGTRTNWFWSCDVCFCTCNTQYDTEYADRSINLMPQTSDLTKNEVMTGVTFIKLDQMIHVQMKTGKIGPQGAIVEETGEWMSTAPLEYVSEGDFGAYWTTVEGKSVRLEPGKNYSHVIEGRNTWFLDSIHAHPGKVLTGIKVEQVDLSGKGDAFRLVVRQTPFNCNTGELYPDEGDTASTWITSDNAHDPPSAYKNERIQVVAHDGDPLVCKQNLPTSDPNQYIPLRRSDTATTAGQLTVPYYRIADTSSYQLALDGVELLWLSNDECGGFLAFRIYTMDLSKCIRAHATDKEFAKLYPPRG